MGRVQDKMIPVSGGAMGMGRTHCELLAREGGQVIVSDMNAERGEQVAADIRKAGGRAEFVPLDVTDETQWKAVVDSVIARHGRIDVLVNNAGILLMKPVQETTTGEWSQRRAVLPARTHGRPAADRRPVAGTHHAEPKPAALGRPQSLAQLLRESRADGGAGPALRDAGASRRVCRRRGPRAGADASSRTRAGEVPHPPAAGHAGHGRGHRGLRPPQARARLLTRAHRKPGPPSVPRSAR